MVAAVTWSCRPWTEGLCCPAGSAPDQECRSVAAMTALRRRGATSCVVDTRTREQDVVVDEVADQARTGGIAAALGAIAPALERFVEVAPSDPVPAFSRPLVGLPRSGVGLQAVLKELAALVDEGCRIGMPGWLGFVTTAPTTGPAVATAAATVAGAQRYLHHSFNHLEHLALRWVAELCGLPAAASGIFTSGGSTANLLALGAARQHYFERAGIDVAEVGLPPGPVRIYTSERAHRTVHRSAAVLGLGRCAVEAVATDPAGHLHVGALEKALALGEADGVAPLAVVAVAGSTDTGSVDDIAAIADVCRSHDVWLHVDGAYGLPGRACPELALRFAGVERADSWIVDPHKWLACGTGVGAAFVRDADLLTRAFAEGHADYLEGTFGPADADATSQFDGFAGGWADQGVELSAPSRGAAVWALLREIGRDGVASRIRRDIGLAGELASLVRAHPDLELLCEPDLSIVCYRFRPRIALDDLALDELNAQIVEGLRHTTTTVPSSTVVDGCYAIRPCFINPRTTSADVQALVENTLRLAASILR